MLRGVAQSDIFRDDVDRASLLERLALVSQEFSLVLLASQRSLSRALRSHIAVMLSIASRQPRSPSVSGSPTPPCCAGRERGREANGAGETVP